MLDISPEFALYVFTSKPLPWPDDERRVLTPLGRAQAAATGRRLFELIASAQTIAERTGNLPE